MKTPRLLLLMLTVLLAVLTPRQAEARVETSFDFFYDSLSPYGEWLQVADYGYCWRPTEVDADWTPYADGYWAFTDAGWTWVSYEDFGGIVYHYGRWVRVEDEGWCWVPEYEWGPAWVSWRNSDEYVGWAPLPPEARWQPNVGIGIWVDRDCDIGPAYFSFCRVRDFGAPVLRGVIINRIENVTIIRRTVNITNITYNTHYGNGPIIFNGGPNFVVINQRSARPIPALKLVQNATIDLAVLRGDHRRNFNGVAVGNQLVVTAPFVKRPADFEFLKPKVTKVIAVDRVTHGWSGVKNDEIRRELKEEMQRQTKGLTRETAPARAVAINDLKVLPEKADPKAPSPVTARENRKDKTPEVAGPNAVENPRTKQTPDTAVSQDADEKKGRGAMSRDAQKPVAGDSTLKPFNPATGTDPKAGREKISGTPSPDGVNPNRQAGTMRPRQGDDETPKKAAQTEQEKALRKQADAAAQQQQIQQQQEAQRQAEALRQQQKDAAAAASRQRMQDDQARAARQQADAAAAQQKQIQELRKQQNDQAADLQRRQAIEQQRAQKEANEQARRAPESQRPQVDTPRPQRQQQQPQPQPQAQPRSSGSPASPTATPTDDRRKKKDQGN